MAKYKLKTTETNLSVEKFLDTVEPEQKRDDCREIMKMMADVTKEPAKMWGPSIIGFGSFHYEYASGHSGDMCRIGFAPRKGNIVLYIGEPAKFKADLKKLGKVKTGKACVYINKLSEIDTTVLKELMRKSLAS